uniref:Ras and Rab interactor 3 n=1 Tax=Esox lucius TaxID=8010 RepID=A0A6Q2ZEZ9_ESOLU
DCYNMVQLMYLEGSVLVFDNIFKLIAFYCISRDILPFTLRLPQVIVQATKYEDIEMMSLLGSDFWGSQLNCSSEEVDQNKDHSSSSCEIQLSVGTANDRLWYVNPIFIEEYFSSLEASGTLPTPIFRSQSLNTPGQVPPKFKRPPPRPPNVPEREVSDTLTNPFTAKQPPQPPSAHGVTAGQRHPGPRLAPHKIPPVPLRRKPSEKCPSPTEQELSHLEEGAPTLTTSSKRKEKEEEEAKVAVASLVRIDDASVIAVEEKGLGAEASVGVRVSPQKQGTSETSNSSEGVTVAKAPLMKKATAPVPPPRRKKSSQATPTTTLFSAVIGGGLLSNDASLTESSLPHPHTPSIHVTAHRPIPFSVGELKETRGADVSLYSPQGGAALPALEHDSYSTSSTEEEFNYPQVSVKRTSTIMLDRAKHRLSMVNFSNVFTNLMSADHKLQKRIVELSRDGSSYFGNLMKDYRVYILETMGKHTSSTELLQEIRQMMTQLKSYLIQSIELQNLLEPNVYTEDKLEVIIEAALCKAVLKPLREAVYSGLKDIHARDGSLKRLKENQSVVLGTTTTDLGVTTSIPEAPVMEKIQLKLMSLHQEYSPQKKIDLLLKACKIIYESMSVGSPGRAHGADDFLPVLMYVLARSDMVYLLLDVEYMMELMDPALQLGEGSYYLTTTYGVLEHIKNYDKQTVTRQLSLEIQDSIHRWERRRTLNKGRVSRSSVQDFINVSFLEAGCNTKTLGVRPATTAQDLCAQCADKFEVLEPESYSLSVLVEGHYQPVAPEEFPLTIKSSLHHSEPRKEYYFVYRPGRTESEGQEAEAESQQQTVMEEPEPEVEESLIEI